ncbi:MAG: hypothetical protein GC161_11175 [Planctomycetaceae bacterium]|nr:hypothetical protein [Planctomycetaceae bacterium]
MPPAAIGLVVAFYLWVCSYSERAFFERGLALDRLKGGPPARLRAREVIAFMIGVNTMGILAWFDQLQDVGPLDGSRASVLEVIALAVSLCVHVAAAVWLVRIFRRAGAHGAQGDRRGDATSSLAATPGAVVDAARRG